MDLERRVKTLEQELEILKNQVQMTLLDIQEKVLTNTYPTLRAESMNGLADEPTVKPSGIRSVAAPAAADYNAADEAPTYVDVRPNSAAPRMSQPDVSRKAPNKAAAMRGQKVVSLEAIGAVHGSSATVLAPQPTQADGIDWERLEVLEQWTVNKIEKIGAKRTYRLLHVYAEQGRIDEYTLNALVELVKVYAGTDTNGKAASSGKAASNRSQNGTGSQAPHPQQPTKPANRSTAHSTHQHAQPAANHRPAASNQAKNRQHEDDHDLVDDSRHNLVLRLIAGVTNASAGINKGKKHG